MSIDQYLPGFEVTERTSAGGRTTRWPTRPSDGLTFATPSSACCSALRELPNRIAHKLRGDPPLPTPTSFTVDAVATPQMVDSGEEPGVEIVVGAVGRFWRRDYGGRTVAAEMFVHFNEPGYAKIAISLR